MEKTVTYQQGKIHTDPKATKPAHYAEKDLILIMDEEGEKFYLQTTTGRMWVAATYDATFKTAKTAIKSKFHKGTNPNKKAEALADKND